MLMSPAEAWRNRSRAAYIASQAHATHACVLPPQHMQHCMQTPMPTGHVRAVRRAS